jgi:hypothetical protein
MPDLTPEQQAEQNRLYEKYIQLLQTAGGLSATQARIQADGVKNAGNLNKEVERLNKQLEDSTYRIDSLASGLKESLAEIRNQNLALQIGKATFKDLASIASDINYQQRGITDFTEKDIKKKEQSLDISKLQLENVIRQLANSKGEYNRQSELKRLQDQKDEGIVALTKNQEKLLDQLKKERDLLAVSKDTLKEGLPLLNQELEISKQIVKTRSDLGGIANAAAETLSKFGGGLAKYLNISDAKEAVDSFNKKLINDALQSQAVQDKIREIEQNRGEIISESAKKQANLESTINNILEEKNQILAKTNEEKQLEIEKAQLLKEIEADPSSINLKTRLVEIESRQNELGRERANKLGPLNQRLQERQNDLAKAQTAEKEKLAKLDEKEAKVKQEAIKSVDTLGNRFKALGVFFSNSLGGLTKLLKDPITLMTTLVEIGFKADKQVTQLGKSFGVSKDVAGKMRDDMASFARSTGDTFINTDRLLKAQTELSEQLGIAVKFSNEELATFAKLTELTGLSAQEAGKLALNASAAGMSTEAYTDGIREGAFSAMQATKTHFSQKEIMQDISKLSAGILTKFQGNPKALAAAVVEAKKLGTDLATVDKIGQSLLNWEQSIENELKAELMTGKQLNLERARAAALSGDQLALTREIQSQVGSAADFSKMNVLAQQSLAEAFGMSRDEMAEMLIKQEAIRDYGEEAAQLNKEQIEDMKRQGLTATEYLKKQEQQRDAQTKFQDAMTKLQGLIANLVDGPVGQLLDALADMVGVAMKIVSVFSPLFDVISFIARQLSNLVSTPLGGLIAGFTALYLLSGKIGSAFGGMWKGIKGMGTSIAGMFKGGEEGSKGFFGRLKEGFKKGVTGTDKTKEAAEKGAEGAEKTSTTADKAKGNDGAGFKKRMQNIAAGIKAFASPNVLKGAINLIPSAAGLILFIPGALAAKIIEIINGERFKIAMQGVAKGIKSFGDNVTLGDIGKLAAGGIALTAFALGVPGLLLLQSVNGKLVEQTLKGIGKGIASLGKAVSNPKVLIGLAAVTLAIMGIGKALQWAAPAIEAFGKVLTAVFEGVATVVTAAANGIATIFTSLQNVDVVKLLTIGPALFGIGVGLAALGGGGILNAIGSFLGGDPIQKLQKLAESGDGLQKTALALQGIATALTQVSTALATINVSKLKELDKFASNRAKEESGGIIGGITKLITSPIEAIGSVVSSKKETTSSPGGPDLTPLISAIREVKASVDKLYGKNTTINMDGNKVGTTLSQGSYKVA